MLVAFSGAVKCLVFLDLFHFLHEKAVGLMCTFDPLLSDGLKTNVFLTWVFALSFFHSTIG